MAISNFKISRAPKRCVMTVDGSGVIIDHSYPISLQNTIVVTASSKGVPYDDFGFKVGNDDQVWSQEYTCKVNALTNSGTPSFTNSIIDIAINEQVDISANFVFDDSTDRIKIVSINPKHGDLLVNGLPMVIGKTYMLYEFINIKFISIYHDSEANVATTIGFQVGNSSGMTATLFTVDLVATANLFGIANSFSEVLGDL